MNRRWEDAAFVGKIAVGCALFALGFNLFLEPNGLNAGGISGLAMVFVHLTKIGSVGIFTFLINLPLFAISCSAPFCWMQWRCCRVRKQNPW